MSIYNKPPADVLERLAKANALIKVISTYGRRFFYSRARDRVAQMIISPKGSVCFIDDYTGCVTILSDHRWPHFTKPTLAPLMRAIALYIATGEKVHIDFIGMDRISGEGNIWGYEAGEMAKCRAAAVATGVVLAAEVTA